MSPEEQAEMDRLEKEWIAALTARDDAAATAIAVQLLPLYDQARREGGGPPPSGRRLKPPLEK